MLVILPVNFLMPERPAVSTEVKIHFIIQELFITAIITQATSWFITHKTWSTYKTGIWILHTHTVIAYLT